MKTEKNNEWIKKKKLKAAVTAINHDGCAVSHSLH